MNQPIFKKLFALCALTLLATSTSVWAEPQPQASPTPTPTPTSTPTPPSSDVKPIRFGTANIVIEKTTLKTVNNQTEVWTEEVCKINNQPLPVYDFRDVSGGFAFSPEFLKCEVRTKLGEANLYFSNVIYFLNAHLSGIGVETKVFSLSAYVSAKDPVNYPKFSNVYGYATSMTKNLDLDNMHIYTSGMHLESTESSSGIKYSENFTVQVEMNDSQE